MRMKQVVTVAVPLAALLLAFSAIGQTPDRVGWVFSRANCVNNESITWLATFTSVGRHLVPKGVSALRKTESYSC